MVAAAGAAGEVAQRLAGADRLPSSRIVQCSVEPGRASLDAAVAREPALRRDRGDLRVTEERVLVALGDVHVPRLDSVVAPHLAPGVPTVVWWPGGGLDALRTLVALADAIVLDSEEPPASPGALAHACALARSARVVDLAWLRTEPWRERVAALFDPPAAPAAIEAVQVRHPPGSETAGLLLLGWLAARLERGRVRLMLEADPAERPPGLSALTLSTTSGRRLALERAPEGLRARDRLPKGRERHWTAFGAARCEALLLGDAIPRGLLPDPAFAAALPAAAALTRRCGDLVPSGRQPQRRPTP